MKTGGVGGDGYETLVNRCVGGRGMIIRFFFFFFNYTRVLQPYGTQDARKRITLLYAAARLLPNVGKNIYFWLFFV